ncbi:hypothetical protein BGW80DRAFT_1406307 [Lactifluus volemus]|nr:hypothetical protein BGW80DRAFT_1406307 [Lactifluus volemus]
MNPSDDTFASFSPTLATRSHPSLSMRVPKVPVKRPPSFLNHNGDAHFHSTALGMSLGKRKYACISSQSTTFSDLCGSPKLEPFTDLENLARLSCSHSLSQLNNPDIIGHVSPLNSIDALFPVVTACHSATSQPSSQLLGSPNMGLSPEGLKDEMVGRSTNRIVSCCTSTGLLNARWLGIFAPTSVRILDLRKCFSTKYGFNRYFMVEALRVFRTPFFFRSLSTLLLENIPLQDDDLLYIQQLPNLSSLNLNNTDICNVGVFHLVALRRTLTTLELGGNPLITDDSVSALLLLSHLRVLGLRGTTVTMTGLRRLVPFSKHLHLDVPISCEQYLSELHTQYMLSPLSSLITRPDEAYDLDLGALKHKLTLCLRLVELLERRRDDLAVRVMALRRWDQGLGDNRK